MICKSCTESNHHRCDDEKRKKSWKEYCAKNNLELDSHLALVTQPYKSCPCLHRRKDG